MNTFPFFMTIARITASAALVLLPSVQAAGAALEETHYPTKRLLQQEIAILEDRASEGELSDSEVFRLGTLYYASRDFEEDIYYRNRLGVKAGRYFFQYKQSGGVLARKNIGLFCIDRVRQSPRHGRDPGVEFHHCSVLVSSYFTPEGALKTDFTVELMILDAMADELLYDVANRYLDWSASDLLSLTDALIEHRLVPRSHKDVQQALVQNLNSRFAEGKAAAGTKQLRTQVLEGILLLDEMLAANEDAAQREKLLDQRAQVVQSPAGRVALSLKVVDELLTLAERARSAVSAHRIVRGSLPSDLQQAEFVRDDSMDYVDGINVSGAHLAISLSSSGELPPAMRGQRIVWSLEKHGVRIETYCSRHTTLKEPVLRSALGCSI